VVLETPLMAGTAYEVIDVIGEGAYGVVVSAVHRPSGTKVAIKKVAPFEHAMFALRTLRELKLLKYFADEGVSENVSTVAIESHSRSYPSWTLSNPSPMTPSKKSTWSKSFSKRISTGLFGLKTSRMITRNTFSTRPVEL
jgi:serine/threonine protein kinase